MRAVTQSTTGGPDTLQFSDLATPIPASGQVLVRVHAAGVNRADIVQREGRYPPPPGASPLLGLEVAGIVTAIGENAAPFAVGDAVLGLVAGGGYAEYALLEAACAITKPDWLSMEQAASLPEAWMTAWLNLVELAAIQPGESVLIHAGASGVGTAAIQLCKLHGARALVTVGSAEKVAFCTKLGAETAINYRQQDFAEVVTAVGGADAILDCIGGDYFERNLSCLKADGRLVNIGLMGGASAKIDIGRLLMKRLSIRGSTLRPQPLEVKARLTAALRDAVLPALAEGRITCTVARVFSWTSAADAHRYLESNANLGKVVLRLVEEAPSQQ